MTHEPSDVTQGLAEETMRALWGSALLLFGRSDAEGFFNMTDRGFKRSFFAFAVALPLFLLAIRLGIPGMETPEQRALASGVMFRQILLIAASWTLWLLLAALIARVLGHARDYGRYVILYNWSTPLAAALQLVPMALFAFGLIRPQAAAFMALFLVGVVLLLRWHNARLGFRAPLLVAMLFPAAELGLNLLLSRLFI